jgi:hypothetical protein
MMELFKGLLIALALVLQETLPDWYPPQDRRRFYVKLAVWLAAILLVPLLEYFFRKGWLSIGIIRRWLHHCANFEGIWLQRVGLPDRPYSIAVIRHAPGRQGWIYEGLGFNRDFEQAAEWDSASLLYNEDRHEWYFKGEAEIKDGADLAPGKEFAVWPILRRSKDRKSNKIKGLVADLAPGTRQAVFTIMLRRLMLPRHRNAGRQFRTIEDIKDMDPGKVRALFETMPSMLLKPR